MKFLALGGNLGPVLQTFDWALQSLDAAGVQVVAVSGAYRTEAMTWPGRVSSLPPYWNAVCQVVTDLPCEAVLRRCQALERAAGRVSGPRWGSRPLDLDVLLWGDAVHDHPDLHVPHPRLHERLFVLRPLHELAPELVVPTLNTSVRALLAGFVDAWSGIMLRRAVWTPASGEKNAPPEGLRVGSQVIAAQGN